MRKRNYLRIRKVMKITQGFLTIVLLILTIAEKLGFL